MRFRHHLSERALNLSRGAPQFLGEEKRRPFQTASGDRQVVFEWRSLLMFHLSRFHLFVFLHARLLHLFQLSLLFGR